MVLRVNCYFLTAIIMLMVICKQCDIVGLFRTLGLNRDRIGYLVRSPQSVWLIDSPGRSMQSDWIA